MSDIQDAANSYLDICLSLTDLSADFLELMKSLGL